MLPDAIQDDLTRLTTSVSVDAGLASRLDTCWLRDKLWCPRLRFCRGTHACLVLYGRAKKSRVSCRSVHFRCQKDLTSEVFNSHLLT